MTPRERHRQISVLLPPTKINPPSTNTNYITVRIKPSGKGEETTSLAKVLPPLRSSRLLIICTCKSQNGISGRVIAASVIRRKLSPLGTPPPPVRVLPVKISDRSDSGRGRQQWRAEQSVGKASQHSGRRAGASWWLPQHDRWDKHTTYTKSLTKERCFFHQLRHAPSTP